MTIHIAETGKFVTRYLKATHCDLFFADAAIFVEGASEKILIPHFIEKEFNRLNRNYISIIEIGGSHVHRFRPLIEKLELLSLIITDLDAINGSTKVQPQLKKGYKTGNHSIKSWLFPKDNLDDVLGVSDEEKVKEGFVRIAYQCEAEVNYNDSSERVISSTFEDALTLSNISLIKNIPSPKGLMKKMSEALKKETINEACQAMFDALGKNSKKAEMALNLLCCLQDEKLNSPQYIHEGLKWLQEKLNKQDVK